MVIMKNIFFLFAVILVTIMINTQAQPWPRYTIDTSYSEADGVRLADVNTNGWQDITAGWEANGNSENKSFIS